MNYLAHAALAEESDEARLGSLLGDFAKGLDETRLHPQTLRSLHEHRAVDRWFDALPAIRAERLEYPPHLRRFSGILIDVFFDHFIVRRWEDLMEPSLEDVTASLYRSLETYEDVLPPRLKSVAPSMSANDWLGSYGDLTNVRRALTGIARRLRRPTPILEGMEVLKARYEANERLVMETFPAAKAFVTQRRARTR